MSTVMVPLTMELIQMAEATQATPPAGTAAKWNPKTIDLFNISVVWWTF